MNGRIKKKKKISFLKRSQTKKEKKQARSGSDNLGLPEIFYFWKFYDCLRGIIENVLDRLSNEALIMCLLGNIDLFLPWDWIFNLSFENCICCIVILSTQTVSLAGLSKCYFYCRFITLSVILKNQTSSGLMRLML